MNNEIADLMIERSKNKRKILIWKIVSMLMLIVIFSLFAYDKEFIFSSPQDSKSSKKEVIGLIEIDGMIIDDYKKVKKISEIAKNKSIKALIVKVDSPGGTIVGSENIYKSLRKVADAKPVVVVMNNLAASGGYLISLAGDHIIAHNGTITGSIGVIFQSAEFTALAEKIGVKLENFKSGELKALPNPTEKTTDLAREALMSSVQDCYEYFVNLVATRRGLTHEEVKKIADGRIYTGRQALNLKLVDEVGDIDSAVKWLNNNKRIPVNLELKEIPLKSSNSLLKNLLDDLNDVKSMITGFVRPNLMVMLK